MAGAEKEGKRQEGLGFVEGTTLTNTIEGF